MRTVCDESDRSVFNDYEESIIFDEDDPDFKPSDDLECSCDKNGTLTSKFKNDHIRIKLKYLVYIQ